MMIQRICKHPVYSEFQAEVLFHVSVCNETGQLIYDLLDVFDTVPLVLPKQLLNEIITHAKTHHIRKFVAEEISMYVNALSNIEGEQPIIDALIEVAEDLADEYGQTSLWR